MIRERLEAYRRQKRKEEMANTIKDKFQRIFPWNKFKSKEEPLIEEKTNDVEDIKDTESTDSEESVKDLESSVLKKVMYLLYFLLWGILYVIAIEYEFGAVYFILSALVFICLNTHSRPRKKGELSAYSVFNPNCEAIEGTLDASQFEREIRYGIGSVR